MLPLRRAHLFSSILLYGTTLLSLTPTVRSASKNFNFSSIYQSGPAGNASFTHYDMAEDFVAACGCSARSNRYPTAAINTAAYGSNIGSGPACGYCFNVSLIEALEATPPFTLAVPDRPWVVVKLTDQCPAPAKDAPEKTWCGATSTQTNQANSFVHFDLSSPSLGIPSSFFPSNKSLYGYTDFGAWRGSYALVSCEAWKGYNDATAVGRDRTVSADAGCCPANPLLSMGDQKGQCAAVAADGARTLLSGSTSIWSCLYTLLVLLCTRLLP